MQFQIVVCQCCQCAEHKGQTRKNAKVVRVPVTRSGQEGTCESKQHTRLLTVHLPSALQCLKEGAFFSMLKCAPHSHCPEVHRLRLLGFQGVPCVELGWRRDQRSNQLAPHARLNVRPFEKCRTLRTIGLDRTEYNPHRTEYNPRDPQGCFPGAGLETNDFCWIGPAAFETSPADCRQWTSPAPAFRKS